MFISASCGVNSTCLAICLGLNFIRPQLATVAGAALPSPYGGVVRQVQVDLDQRALHSYGLSADDVGIALAANHARRHREDRQIRIYDQSQ
jgi:Cu/Ag efflux pump CusA